MKQNKLDEKSRELIYSIKKDIKKLIMEKVEKFDKEYKVNIILNVVLNMMVDTIFSISVSKKSEFYLLNEYFFNEIKSMIDMKLNDKSNLH